MHTHMHASNYLLTLTNMRVTGRTLHQPRGLTSPGSHSLACRVPQVFRPPEGRRTAAAKRCRGGRCRGRWGGCGGCRSLRACAGRRRRRWRLRQLHRCAREAPPPAARTAQGSGRPRARRARAARGAVPGVRASGRGGSRRKSQDPGTPWGGDGAAGSCSPATLGVVGRSGTRR